MDARDLEAGDVSWFGGGMDLTPCKEFVEDTRHFHRVLQKVCNAHGAGMYDRFSRWAKEYFFIGHRGSERGVGGIFFDYLRGEERWSFVRDVGEAFLPAYAPLVERRRSTPYSDEDRAQHLRWRGRYVEFNLIYDRGTLFGLRTGGNVEAIFMSLPPLVAWSVAARGFPTSPPRAGAGTTGPSCQRSSTRRPPRSPTGRSRGRGATSAAEPRAG